MCMPVELFVDSNPYKFRSVNCGDLNVVLFTFTVEGLNLLKRFGVITDLQGKLQHAQETIINRRGISRLENSHMRAADTGILPLWMFLERQRI